MANVWYWSGSWTSGGDGDDLGPGETHDWIMWGYNYGDAITLTAHPVGGADENILAIENVQIQADGSGRRLFYTVRNVGSNFITGYAVGFAGVSQ
jgi:hypothetical protein